MTIASPQHLQPEAETSASSRPRKLQSGNWTDSIAQHVATLNDALSAAKMSNPTSQTYQWPSKTVKTDYPLIDNDPHFMRVVRYARTSDYVHGVGAGLAGPGLLYAMERFAPSQVGKGGFAQAMRLAGFIGLTGGFLYYYQRSILRFYGMSENAREVQMDMREMVDKVKAGEPLYGESKLTPAMQGVAARQSRYSALFFGVLPWFNFVNHNQHGVDTAKYYQQAERELEAERLSKGSS